MMELDEGMSCRSLIEMLETRRLMHATEDFDFSCLYD